MSIIQGFGTLHGDELEEQLRLGHSLYIVDMNSVNGSPMLLLVMLIEVYPDGKSGKFGWGLIWPDEYAPRSPTVILFLGTLLDCRCRIFSRLLVKAWSFYSTNSFLRSGATKEDFWVYSATGQEQYDFAVEKTKNLPAKYLTVIKRSDPQSCVPILRLVSRFSQLFTHIH